MSYCRTCVLPDTRPNLSINADGQCNACCNHETKEIIDWQKREEDLKSVIAHAKSRARGYDCVIPVSGGKDSTWQVVKCLEYGLNPLCVTWKAPSRTDIGQRNLDNLISLGVDHIDYRISPKVEKKFLYESLCRYGATAIPMHMAMFSIPLKIALRFDIPLVVWGENPAFEYGSEDDEKTGFALDEEWLKSFGVTHGTTAGDWIGETLTEKEMTPYFGPTDEDLKKKGILAFFLGHYLSWSPEATYETALAHGFEARTEGPRTGYFNYADIDDDFISTHHWLKWYKFGFTRLWDNLSLEIRNGHLSRDKAIEIITERGDETPLEDIEKFCTFLEIPVSRFFEIAEEHRNHDIWVQRNENWEISDFLIPDWSWS